VDLQCGEPGGRRPHHRFGVKQFPQRLLVDDMDETADSPRERCAWLRTRPAFITCSGRFPPRWASRWPRKC
jgi:hypothetical protein